MIEEPPIEAVELPARWKRLIEAIDANDVVAAHDILESATADDQRRIVSQLDIEDRERLCRLLPVGETAELIENLAEAQAVEMLEEMPADVAADVLEELPADLSGDLLRELDDRRSEAILAEIDDLEESKDLRERAGYEWDSAGGLMSDHVVSFPEHATVADVLAELGNNAEEYSDDEVQYFYVTGENMQLTGVLALRNLVLGRRSRSIGELMIPGPVATTVDTGLEELQDLFESKNYLAFPVVDAAGQLKGIVSRSAVNEALSDAQTEDYLKSSGIVGGEELRSMPLRERCVRRLAWLGPNILLNLLAASIIASYEDTLQSVIALAVFLPMVSDMSGCSGNQAVAVSIRELTLGIIQPRDYVRVLLKEVWLGLNNGVVLGIVLGTLAAIWKGNVYLGLVIGGALMLNTILSVAIGGLVPLILKKFKVDPALASGPILTTCTDMSGFFLVLSLANVAMTRLV
ncbi:magnesium transporter MgtE [Oceaniferula spumae]|uniref:Magnesium transporter MgtE n=1 Tax=Oceaniferula spumae TaxID=2979115 RepID=A0AAT9FIP7_9BACT